MYDMNVEHSLRSSFPLVEVGYYIENTWGF
jgi:hypothetical protein